MINYTFFRSPYHGKLKYAKIFSNFQILNLNFRKTENVQILFRGICAKIYAKLCNLLPFLQDFHVHCQLSNDMNKKLCIYCVKNKPCVSIKYKEYDWYFQGTQ